MSLKIHHIIWQRLKGGEIMKIKNLKELNGAKRGVFTIVIDEEKNGLAITGRFFNGDMIVYFKELNKVSEIIKDIKAFGFEIKLEEKRIFKILFDKELEKVVMTSKEIISKDIEIVASYYNIKHKDYDKFINVFRDIERYEILEVEI